MVETKASEAPKALSSSLCSITLSLVPSRLQFPSSSISFASYPHLASSLSQSIPCIVQWLTFSILPSSSALQRKPILPLSFRAASGNWARTQIQAALSSTMTEGKIVYWVKSKGDKLSKGESVVVVESDKADMMDVETFYDGYLAAIMAEEDGVAAVGSVIAIGRDGG